MKNLPILLVGAAVVLVLGITWAVSARRGSSTGSPSTPTSSPATAAKGSSPANAIELDPSSAAGSTRAVPESDPKLTHLDGPGSKHAVPLGDAASNGATDPFAPDAMVAPTDSEANSPTKATFLAKYEGYQPAELRQAYEDLQRWIESNAKGGSSPTKLDQMQVDKIVAEAAWLKERINN